MEFTLLIAKVALGDPAILIEVVRIFAVFMKCKIHCLQENSELSSPPQPQRTYVTRSGADTPASYHSVLAESRANGGSLPWRLWHFVLRIQLVLSCFL